MCSQRQNQRRVLVRDNLLRPGEKIAVFDIGGTSFRLAIGQLAEGSASEIIIIHEEERHTQDVLDPVSTVHQMVRDFLPLRSMVVAIARPVDKGRCCAGGSIPWSLDEKDIARTIGCPCKLMNDFEPVGWGAANGVDPEETILLHAGIECHPGSMAVLGPGTGLGMAAIPYFEEVGRHLVMPTEGGHVALGMRSDKLQRRFRNWLQKFKGVTIYDDVVSGRGFPLLLEFVLQSDLRRYRSPADYELRELLADPSQARSTAFHADITQKALSGTHKACSVAVGMWVNLLGEAARNLALCSLPRGGLYITGGISPRLLGHQEFRPHFTSQFRDGFLDTPIPADRQLLETIPVRAVLRNIAIPGAIAYAARMKAAA